MSKLQIALVGYANVGKSVIFNYLTGLHQHIGNWSGKTITRSEGSLFYGGSTIQVLDLPGISSLFAYSEEEIITREYIRERPDFIVNVLDASSLETNLILTIQLLELERPMVLAINMSDILIHKGLTINYAKLSKLLNIPVLPVTASQGKGISEVLDAILNTKNPLAPQPLIFGKEIEEELNKIIKKIEENKLKFAYPSRLIAIKLLEKDPKIRELVEKKPDLLIQADESIANIEKIHGHDSALVIADERVTKAHHLAAAVTKTSIAKNSRWQKLQTLTTDRVWGYLIMIAVFSFLFLGTFCFIKLFGSYFEAGFQFLTTLYQKNIPNRWWKDFLWSGLESGYDLFQLIVLCIFPFYMILHAIEDSGYFARIAFLMDPVMHRIGVHGKACIPMVLGFGCNVPACLGCRIMETTRERFLTGILTSFIPCGAVSVVIGGLVVRYLGWMPTVILYGFLILTISFTGIFARLLANGRETELIMRMPEYRRINFKTVMIQTWLRLKEFIFLAGPIVIVLGMVFSYSKFLQVNQWLTVITKEYLGLPVELGIVLILVLLRKELILVVLSSLLGTSALNQVLTSEQLFIIATFTLFSPPCVATLAALRHEFGIRRTVIIFLVKLLIAFLMCGIMKILWPLIAQLC